MNCKTCGTSDCELVSESSTMLSFGVFKDDEGNYHHHDENNVRQKWKCNNDHHFTCKGFNHCWCGWGGWLNDVGN